MSTAEKTVGVQHCEAFRAVGIIFGEPETLATCGVITTAKGKNHQYRAAPKSFPDSGVPGTPSELWVQIWLPDAVSPLMTNEP